MALAHSIRIATSNKYDIVDILEMEPLRRRMLVASLHVEVEEREEEKKKTKSKRPTKKRG